MPRMSSEFTEISTSINSFGHPRRQVSLPGARSLLSRGPYFNSVGSHVATGGQATTSARTASFITI